MADARTAARTPAQFPARSSVRAPARSRALTPARAAVGAPSAEAAAEMGGRGHLVVQDRAVQRIAEAAAVEVEGVAPAGATTGAIGNALGRDYPRVDCEVAGHRVRVRLEIVTVWPHSAAEVAAAVGDHVRERLRVLAGMSVDSTRVTVARVAPPTTAAPRRRVR
ncbi:Asp23/Gls24 family envelope stress response protein [Kineococcus sp. SYSU DK005]|uniref:Asp23/Gls24 family envelope stress response protein n=1 Tax=Kineococcus sp. SYSU DK005 TaxID=3383126 RepID=UPI003D7C73F6